jgi:aspartate aminotransferase-like enzyme
MFMPGSGTIGVEAVFASLNSSPEIIGVSGIWKDRWKSLSANYQKPSSGLKMSPLLETSCSSLNSNSAEIVDAISGFPYYELPQETKVFITCTNKVLGSLAGIAILGVKKDSWDLFSSDTYMSYLNLQRYREFAERQMTPSTAPTYIFDHLLGRLNNFDLDRLRSDVNRRSDLIVNAIGSDAIIGESQCPVITVKPSKLDPRVAERFSLYKGGIDGAYSIFTYSEIDSAYESFASAARG